MKQMIKKKNMIKKKLYLKIFVIKFFKNKNY